MISNYRIHFLVTVLIPAESRKAITISLCDLFIFLYLFILSELIVSVLRSEN